MIFFSLLHVLSLLLLIIPSLGVMATEKQPSSFSTDIKRVLSGILPLSVHRALMNVGSAKSRLWLLRNKNRFSSFNIDLNLKNDSDINCELYFHAGAIDKVTENRSLDHQLWEAFDTVLIYVHGGGFMSGSAIKSIPALSEILDHLKEKSFKPAILGLNYGLSPENVFPYALEQVISVVEKVSSFRTTGKKNHLYLIGDSAGGNLVVSAALAMAKSATEIVPLSGVIAVSPWLDLSMSSDSYERNRYFDTINIPALSKKARLYAPNAPLDSNYLISPHFISDDELSFLAPRLPPHVLFAGDAEVMFDECEKFSNRLLQAGVDSRLVIGEGGMTHVSAFHGGPKGSLAIKALLSDINKL